MVDGKAGRLDCMRLNGLQVTSAVCDDRMLGEFIDYSHNYSRLCGRVLWLTRHVIMALTGTPSRPGPLRLTHPENECSYGRRALLSAIHLSLSRKGYIV